MGFNSCILVGISNVDVDEVRPSSFKLRCDKCEAVHVATFAITRLSRECHTLFESQRPVPVVGYPAAISATSTY